MFASRFEESMIGKKSDMLKKNLCSDFSLGFNA